MLVVGMGIVRILLIPIFIYALFDTTHYNLVQKNRHDVKIYIYIFSKFKSYTRC